MCVHKDIMYGKWCHFSGKKKFKRLAAHNVSNNNICLLPNNVTCIVIITNVGQFEDHLTN